MPKFHLIRAKVFLDFKSYLFGFLRFKFKLLTFEELILSNWLIISIANKDEVFSWALKDDLIS